MIKIDDVGGNAEDKLGKLRELVSQLGIIHLENECKLQEALDIINTALLKVKNWSEHGKHALRLVILVFQLSEMVSEAYACASVSRTILPALYFYESLAINEIKKLGHLENQYSPPKPTEYNAAEHLPHQDTKCALPQEGAKLAGAHDTINDVETDDDEEDEDMTSSPPMIQPFQKQQNLMKTLRDIRRCLICFEVKALLNKLPHSPTHTARIARLLTFLVFEAAHIHNILPDFPCLQDPTEFHEYASQALHIIYSTVESDIERRNSDNCDVMEVEDVELDDVKNGKPEATIELNIIQLCGGYESVCVPIPVALLKDEDENKPIHIFFEKLSPQCLTRIWAKNISSSIEGLDKTKLSLTNAFQLISEYEKVGRIKRWADVSRIKTRLFVLPFLSDSVTKHYFLAKTLDELKRAYFVNAFVGGVWDSFWTIILLLTLTIVFLQIISAESVLSLFNLWNSKDKYAITAILYESTNSRSVLTSVYCISAIPLLWGLYKGVKATLSIAKDPKEEFGETLVYLEGQAEEVEVLAWFSRVFWWDRLRWNLPLYKLKNQLDGLMDLIRWDARISAADRFDSLTILMLLYQKRGGETRSVVSGYIAEIVDIMRVDELRSVNDNESAGNESLLAWDSQASQDEALVRKSTKLQAIEFLLTIGSFPRTEWAHTRWYARPTLLWSYLEGRYLNWWIGLASSTLEFCLFLILTFFIIAMSFLFLSTAVEAIREYAACPQMKGVTFTGPAPYVGKFDSDCWSATMHEFGRIPGQPSETLTSLLPKFYFSKQIKQYFTLDITGKHLDGDQIGKLIDGFSQQGFTIKRLLAKQCSVGSLTIKRPGFLNTFSNALESISSSLEVLDLSECNLSDGSSLSLKDTSEWLRFYNVLAGLSQLKTLNLAGNYIGYGFAYDREAGTNMSVLFIRSLSGLKRLQELDLSSNFIAYCDEVSLPELCVEVGKAIFSMQSLKTLKLKDNVFPLGGAGVIGMLDSIKNPELSYLDVSQNIILSMPIKYSILSLLSRHEKLEHLDVSRTELFFINDNSVEDYTQRVRSSFDALKGTLKFLNVSETALIGTVSTSGFIVSALNVIGTLGKTETLDLHGNAIGAFKTIEVASSLADMLSNLGSLRKLNVHDNFLGFQMWDAIDKHTKQHPEIEFIPYLISKDSIASYINTSLQNGRLSFENRLISGFVDSEDSFSETQRIYNDIFNTIAEINDPVTSLDLRRVGLNIRNPYELKMVGEGLVSIALEGKKLQELSLADNFIADCSYLEALAPLADGIRQHGNTLKHLDLSGRGVTISSYFALAIEYAFGELGQLESLNFSRNVFELDLNVYELIGKGLEQLKSLKKLVLGYNFGYEINDQGVTLLLDSISKLDTLEELYLADMNLGNHPNILLAFSKVFALPNLRVLHLQRNELGFGGNNVFAFLENLKAAKNLRELDLADNRLGLAPAFEAQTVDAIKSFEHICTLRVSGNFLGFNSDDSNSKGFGDLIEMLPRLIGYEIGGVVGVDWTEHTQSIHETIARDLRSKCESRVCRGSKVAVAPPTCPI